MMTEENPKTLLSPYATGNGFDTWKRMMRVRVHQAKLQRTTATGPIHSSSDPKLATPLTKSTEKLINQNSNKLLVAKSSLTLRGGNGSWTLGSTASSPKRGQVQQYGRGAQALQQRTSIPVQPPHPAFPTLGGHARNRTTPPTLLTNSRGLMILSDNIHARTRRRIQRYSTAKKRQVQVSAATVQQKESLLAEREQEVDDPDPFAACHMILIPQVRTAAKARCQEEVDKFNRIIRWLEDCKEAMADGEFEVDLPSITE